MSRNGNRLPRTLPRADADGRLFDDPLGFLARARALHGDAFVLREPGPIFSRSPDCNGAVAVFGAQHIKAVLGDIELYGMPVSAAQHLSLPPRLVNLNCGLHSMRGEQHARHQRLLTRALGERGIEEQREAVADGLEAFAAAWRTGRRIGLLGEMRRLALEVSTRMLLGGDDAESAALASKLQAYFQLRREAAAPFNASAEALRGELIARGTELDESLREHVRRSRGRAQSRTGGVVSRLALLELEGGARAAEDELVAHANVLFVSGTEPVAVSLTWTLLVLSQLPGLRRALRQELAEASDGEAARARRGPTLLDSVLSESLRLLTPNALMARVTTRPAALGDFPLPARCEVVLCPFLAHREPGPFPRPDVFLPSRWAAARPSPYEYFPFGGGGHSCVGRHLALYVIKAALSLLLPRYDIVLDGDQEIDWRIHIMLTPRNDPAVKLLAPDAPPAQAGRLRGPVAELISLDGWNE